MKAMGYEMNSNHIKDQLIKAMYAHLDALYEIVALQRERIEELEARNELA